MSRPKPCLNVNRYISDPKSHRNVVKCALSNESSSTGELPRHVDGVFPSLDGWRVVCYRVGCAGFFEIGDDGGENGFLRMGTNVVAQA